MEMTHPQVEFSCKKKLSLNVVNKNVVSVRNKYLSLGLHVFTSCLYAWLIL